MLVNINADTIKQLREGRCWSQQQLADLAGLSLRTVQRIEAKAVASQESVKCLAAVFEVSSQDLLKGTTTTAAETASAGAHDNKASTAGEDKGAQHRAYRSMYLSFGVVFASHLFAFICIFTAHNAGSITQDTFQLLKNTVSVALIFSAIALFVRDKKLKKRFKTGSSIN